MEKQHVENKPAQSIAPIREVARGQEPNVKVEVPLRKTKMILLIEDDGPARKTMEMWLPVFLGDAPQKLEVSIKAPTNIEDLERALTEEKYDLILTDGNLEKTMPKDGHEIVRGIREGHYGEFNRQAQIVDISGDGKVKRALGSAVNVAIDKTNITSRIDLIAAMLSAA